VEKANLCKCGCGQPVKEGKRFIRFHHLPVYNKTTKARIHLSRIQRERFKVPENHPFYGKHHTDETKRRISSSRKSLRLSEDPSYIYLKPNFQDQVTMSYILGVLLGDGTIGRYGKKHYDYSARLKVKDREFAESFASALRIIGLHPNLRKVNLNNPNWHDCWLVSVRSKALYFWFKSVSLQKLLESNHHYQISFLRGFFESEGCFYPHRYFDKRRGRFYEKYVTNISNNNENLALLVYNLVQKMGFRPNIRYNRNKNGTRNYIVYLSRKDEVKSFLEVLNPCIPRKRWHEIGYN
jgi:intein-encoded DNA endonuclease-like protein